MIRLLAVLGFIISIYALHIRKMSTNPKHKALCDISENISCTKALGSEYGAITGFPNPLVGLFFYAIVFLLADTSAVPILAGVAVLASLVLAYISYVKQRNFCLVCTAAYVINILILLESMKIIP